MKNFLFAKKKEKSGSSWTIEILVYLCQTYCIAYICFSLTLIKVDEGLIFYSVTVPFIRSDYQSSFLYFTLVTLGVYGEE